MAILDQIKSMLADGENGTLSSKRVITFIATFLVSLAFIANLFWKFTVEEFMYSSMMAIVLAGLGTTVAEKFAPKKKD
jgi:FtsH-binding integral membrane protein